MDALIDAKPTHSIVASLKALISLFLLLPVPDITYRYNVFDKTLNLTQLPLLLLLLNIRWNRSSFPRCYCVTNYI